MTEVEGRWPKLDLAKFHADLLVGDLFARLEPNDKTVMDAVVGETKDSLRVWQYSKARKTHLLSEELNLDAENENLVTATISYRVLPESAAVPAAVRRMARRNLPSLFLSNLERLGLPVRSLWQMGATYLVPNTEIANSVFPLPAEMNPENIQAFPIDEIRGIRGEKRGTEADPLGGYSFLLDRPEGSEVYLKIWVERQGVVIPSTPSDIYDDMVAIAGSLIYTNGGSK